MKTLAKRLFIAACTASIAVSACACSDAGFVGDKAKAGGGGADATKGPEVDGPGVKNDAGTPGGVPPADVLSGDVPSADVPPADSPGDATSIQTEDDKERGLVASSTNSVTKKTPDPLITDDGTVKGKPSYTIPKLLTAFYKKYNGSTNYYGKVEGNGPKAGNFYQVVCPSGSFSASGTAAVHFMVLVGATWTKYSLGDTVPVDPKLPIYAKIEFDTHQLSGVDDHHFTKDANVDIRSYFGPHPQYPSVSIAISTAGSTGSWQVGIGRGKDATRHPPTPDNTYMSPPPACD